MLTNMKSWSLALFLSTAALVTPAFAETAEQLAVRLTQMEDQMRRLMGQVEELNYQVQQLRSQQGQTQQTGEGGVVMQPPVIRKKRVTVAESAPRTLDQGVESIEEVPLEPLPSSMDDGGQETGLAKAPGPKILGTMANSAAQPEDGGFQGQVLVPLGGGDVQSGNLGTNPDAIETVSLNAESPESLYERSNESLLRRKFDDAEAGFRSFMQKYPDHNLAGSAQYWLGETYYAQGNYREAAQNFLHGYQQYPKSRRAPESLLKLGVSLARLGQKTQACAAYGAVSADYPKAVEAKKRAQAEAKRAGC